MRRMSYKDKEKERIRKRERYKERQIEYKLEGKDWKGRTIKQKISKYTLYDWMNNIKDG